MRPAESCRISSSAEADVSPDLRNAKIYYSALGNRENIARAGKFLASIKKELRQMLSKKVVLKYSPDLQFIFDASGERALKILAAIDEIDAGQKTEGEAEKPE